MRKTLEMDLEFQAEISGPPATPKQQYDIACGNDAITIDSWKQLWIDHMTANHAKYGPWSENGIGQLFDQFKMRPCIVVGSGPSLANNIQVLAANKTVPVISCLHNFHYLEDNGVKVDYYVTLDAGEVTIEEVHEGGAKTPEEYWAMTRDKTLCAFMGSSPNLINKWQGKILWFNCPIPSQPVKDAYDAVEPFHTMVSTGGNVLGACFYIAKAICGANPIIFTGADFAFSYTKQFHPWPSKYDGKLGHAVRAHDIFGNAVWTWSSYQGFRSWFESICCSVPGTYFNATEGGTLGAYADGNIRQIKQTALVEILQQYGLNDCMRDQCENPKTTELKVLF